jgi:HAE1 family hydrophobic/amphiphilic exporter-1
MLFVCALGAFALQAQTTRSTTPRQSAVPQPAPVNVDAKRANVSVSQTPATIDTSQTTTQTVTAPINADTDKDVKDPRAMRLSLDDAINTALQRNVGIELQRFDYQIAGQDLRSTYGVFDWLATADVQRQSREFATTSTFQASASRSTIANVGISQTIPTGGTYSVGFNNSRNVSAGGGTFVNPSVNPSLAFGFNQPLLRNFGVDTTTRGIVIARNTLGINKEQFRSVLMDTTHAVQQAYLDLIYARQFIDVVKESLFLARDQARITQIRIDVGASAPLDILQPRVQIATAEESLINAVAAVRDAEDRLRALMHLEPGEWDRPIIPTEKVDYTPINVSAEESVARAFELRPELKQLKLTEATREVQFNYAKNQTLPQVDMRLNYNLAGIAGTTRDFDPNGVLLGSDTTRYPTALRQIFTNDFPSWTIAFNVGLPVTNIFARAEAKRAELELSRSKTDEEQTRETIAVQVRATVRAIDTSLRNIAATRTAREAAERNVEAERRRYENGMTTNFQVLQVQQQLSDARARELQAQVGYNKAVAAYHRAVGDLLDTHNIRVDEPTVEEPKFPGFFRHFTRYNQLNSGNRSFVDKGEDY